MRINKIPVQNQYAALSKFTNKIKNDISNNKQVSLKNFSCSMNDITHTFVKNNKQNDINRLLCRFAEFLVSTKNDNLAGIIYSSLIKLNIDNPKLIEDFAQKALAIAKRQKDPVHIMARANVLKEIYKIINPGSKKHLKFLYDEKRALGEICKNYESAQKRFQTVTRKMGKIASYEKQLAAIKIEIAEIIMTKAPTDAKIELLTALELLQKYGEGKNTAKIQKLLSELKIK